jgi:uncharacterized protein (TIGR00255 family)
MTGYGRASAQQEGWSLTWEIRSLHNRHLDLKWKIPPTLYAHQKDWENEVKAVASRGGVELFLGLKIMNPELQSLSLDTTMAASMLRELDLLAASMDVPHAPDLNRLLGISALWKDSGSIENPELVQSLTGTLRQALADWDAARGARGQALERTCAPLRAAGRTGGGVRDLASRTAADASPCCRSAWASCWPRAACRRT